MNHSDCIHTPLVKKDGMSQIIMTTAATKTDRGVTRMCGMQTVETSIERSGREDTREDARKQGGTQRVGRSIERSGEWDMKGDGLWEADTIHAVSQRQDKWDGRLPRVKSLPTMVPPT